MFVLAQPMPYVKLQRRRRKGEEIILKLKDKMEVYQDMKIKELIYSAIEKIKSSTGKRFLKILKGKEQ